MSTITLINIAYEILQNVKKTYLNCRYSVSLETIVFYKIFSFFNFSNLLTFSAYNMQML